MTSRSVPGAALTSADPPVNVRKMVGIRTETLTHGPPFLKRSPRSWLSGQMSAGVRRLPRLECRECRPDRRQAAVGVTILAEHVERLQAVAGVDDDGLGRGVEQPLGEQAAQHAEGHPGSGLAEDPL